MLYKILFDPWPLLSASIGKCPKTYLAEGFVYAPYIPNIPSASFTGRTGSMGLIKIK